MPPRNYMAVVVHVDHRISLPTGTAVRFFESSGTGSVGPCSITDARLITDARAADDASSITDARSADYARAADDASSITDARSITEDRLDHGGLDAPDHL